MPTRQAGQFSLSILPEQAFHPEVYFLWFPALQALEVPVYFARSAVPGPSGVQLVPGQAFQASGVTLTPEPDASTFDFALGGTPLSNRTTRQPDNPTSRFCLPFSFIVLIEGFSSS